MRAQFRLSGPRNAAQQLGVRAQCVQQPRRRGAVVEGKLGTQVCIRLAVDDLHRVEVETVNDVQRGLPATPLQVGSWYLLPVQIGVALQGGNRRPGNGWQISYFRHVVLQPNLWLGLTREPGGEQGDIVAEGDRTLRAGTDLGHGTRPGALRCGPART